MAIHAFQKIFARKTPSASALRLAVRCSAAVLVTLSVAGCHDDRNYFPIFQPYDVPNSVVITDFNGDGSPDIAVAATHIDSGYPNAGFVSVILQNHATPGTFMRGVDTAVGNNPAILAAGDLNGTGGTDLVVANSASANVSLLLQDSSGMGVFPSASSLTTGGQPNDVAVGDLNGDTLLDIAVADVGNSGNVIVLFQDAANHGHYLAQTNLAVGNPTTAVAIGDINGDNHADLVVTSQNASTGVGQVSVFFADSANPGHFLTRVDFAAGTQPSSVKLADVDGDGRLDILVTNQGAGNGSGTSGVSVILQSATTPGTFLAPITYATARGAIDVAVGDLNGDGKLDLVVVNSGGSSAGSVSVLLQDVTRPGVFLTAQTYRGVFGPLSVAIGDLNNDNLPDIALADGYRATIMFNNTTTPGTFATPVLVGN